MPESVNTLLIPHLGDNPQLSQERVRSVLNYSPETGIFRWRWREDVTLTWNMKFAGKIAGCLTKRGYITIAISDTYYLAHRLAWLYVYGEWPQEADHRNQNKADNRIKNLRQATRVQNGRNRVTFLASASGYRGVYIDKVTGKWRSRIKVEGRLIYLGTHDTAELASAAYQAASLKFFGEFSPLDRENT